jgi:hypothetical protein
MVAFTAHGRNAPDYILKEDPAMYFKKIIRTLYEPVRQTPSPGMT